MMIASTSSARVLFNFTTTFASVLLMLLTLGVEAQLYRGCQDLTLDDGTPFQGCIVDRPNPLTYTAADGTAITLGMNSNILVGCIPTVPNAIDACVCIVTVDPSDPPVATDDCSSCQITVISETEFDNIFDCSNRLTGPCVGLDENRNCISNDGGVTPTPVAVPAPTVPATTAPVDVPVPTPDVTTETPVAIPPAPAPVPVEEPPTPTDVDVPTSDECPENGKGKGKGKGEDEGKGKGKGKGADYDDDEEASGKGGKGMGKMSKKGKKGKKGKKCKKYGKGKGDEVEGNSAVTYNAQVSPVAPTPDTIKAFSVDTVNALVSPAPAIPDTIKAFHVDTFNALLSPSSAPGKVQGYNTGVFNSLLSPVSTPNAEVLSPPSTEP
jgi:hypothetical protein